MQSIEGGMECAWCKQWSWLGLLGRGAYLITVMLLWTGYACIRFLVHGQAQLRVPSLSCRVLCCLYLISNDLRRSLRHCLHTVCNSDTSYLVNSRPGVLQLSICALTRVEQRIGATGDGGARKPAERCALIGSRCVVDIRPLGCLQPVIHAHISNPRLFFDPGGRLE
ncbi:hypothetical protein BJ912DRAFT_1503 [Pholiota molesta]|nr:hypothetical protein BJ912DRAFT_1503 [Pholiota molesta]